jgi:hypothetical protein
MGRPKLKSQRIVITVAAPLSYFSRGKLPSSLNDNFKVGLPANDNARSLKITAIFRRLLLRPKRIALRRRKQLGLLADRVREYFANRVRKID